MNSIVLDFLNFETVGVANKSHSSNHEIKICLFNCDLAPMPVPSLSRNLFQDPDWPYDLLDFNGDIFRCKVCAHTSRRRHDLCKHILSHSGTALMDSSQRSCSLL